MVDYSVVVCLCYVRHVVHTAVADFQGVPVPDCVQLVFFGEVLIHEGKELSANVCFNVFAVRRVEPCYFSFPLALFFFGGVSVLWCVG